MPESVCPPRRMRYSFESRCKGSVNTKVEGVSVVQKGHQDVFDRDKSSVVAVVNDNDFNIDGTTNDEKLDVLRM